MARTSTGHRHEISYQLERAGDLGDYRAFIRAVCLCKELNKPARFDRLRAEEDARDHMVEFSKQGKGRPRKHGK